MFKILFLGILAIGIIGCEQATEADTPNDTSTTAISYAVDAAPVAANDITLVQGRRLVEGRRPNRFGVVTLSWTPPTLNTDGSVLTNLTSYTIYYGTDSNALSPFLLNIDAGLSEYVVENLNSKTLYYFTITATSSSGIESTQSNMVSKETI